MEIIKGTIDCQPEETGYDSTALSYLHEHFERLMDRKIIHGAQYTISHKGKIIANGAIGAGSSVEEGVKMLPDEVFKIYSITKIFTAVAIMQLVEKGLIRLDTYMSDILPAFDKEPFKYITVWNMLTHTSGLWPDGGCYPEEEPSGDGPSLEDMWKQCKDGEFDFVTPFISAGLKEPIGTHWMYNSRGFMILGEVIRKLTGQFAHGYIEDNIVKPLGMKDSGFLPTKDMAARCYLRREKDIEIREAVIAGTFRPDPDDFWNHIPMTGNGLYSTTRDLIRFGNMLLQYGRLDGSRILGRKAVEKMTTYQLHNVVDTCWGSQEKDRKFGIGFDMKQGPAYTYSDGSYFHEGYGACSLTMDPKEQLCAAWFVPWNETEWCADALFNVQDIIWSGLI